MNRVQLGTIRVKVQDIAALIKEDEPGTTRIKDALGILEARVLEELKNVVWLDYLDGKLQDLTGKGVGS